MSFNEAALRGGRRVREELTTQGEMPGFNEAALRGGRREHSRKALQNKEQVFVLRAVR